MSEARPPASDLPLRPGRAGPRLRAAGAAAALLGAVLLGVSGARAEEGMWLFSAPPVRTLGQTYGFSPDPAWFNHLMKASVRFNVGGSGAFVSPNGLVITNHHVGLDALQKMSDPGHDYPRDGYYARTPAQEIPCLDLELDVLQSIEDVTARVNAAVPAGAGGDQAALARRRIIARIERESRASTGLRSDVVTLYGGGAYHLYRMKRYTDIRLVFAPEQQAAFYGGDPDNFEFPRYDLDFCIFRVYEKGVPVHPADFLKWSARGAAQGDLVFVTGHPGHTDRFLTVAELDFLRDVHFPLIVRTLKSREVALNAWSLREEENARRSKEQLFFIRNSRKVRDGMLAKLQTPAFNEDRRRAEDLLKARIAAGGPAVEPAQSLAAFDRIAAAQAAEARDFARYRLLEGEAAFYCDSFDLARSLVRAGDERPKPDGERLHEYTEARRDSFEQALFSEKPIYEDLETVELTDSLTEMVSTLGYDDPDVQRVLAGQSPRERAAALIHGTRIRDVAYRRALLAGGAPAVAAAAQSDPLLALARSVDAQARRLRRAVEAQEEIKKQAQAQIGRARFALNGTSGYPDCTFTLRLAYGTVKGYEEDGRPVPALTTMSGLFERADRHHGLAPFDLPPRWTAHKADLDLTTPFDFVSTCDTTGGNSGSPTVNRAGELVGVIFDGNIQTLGTDLAYDPGAARAVSVHSAAIIEALRKVYGAAALADELSGGGR